MAEDIALSVKGLQKVFKLPHERASSLKERILHFKRASFEKFHVLKGIDFEVKRGEFFGVVGRNGSGKSTLLKIIGGIYQPTNGTVEVNGTLTPFIELGIGFNPELTGRENVFLNGAILGLTHKEIAAKYHEIVKFAELEKFMDQKLKNYSSGMQVRLAFSIAIQAHNDILLIDEVLAVGDANFQRKCFEVFKEIKNSDKTVIFISHDMNAIREYCDKAVLIDQGKIISAGDPEVVANDYIQLFNADADYTPGTSKKRWGDHKAKIEDLTVVTDKKTIKISYSVHAFKDIKDPICGLIIRNSDNHHLFDSNTKWKSITTGEIKKGEKLQIEWIIPNVFRNDTYRITPAVAHEDGYQFYDWWEEAAKFNVLRSVTTAGYLVLNDKISVSKV